MNLTKLVIKSLPQVFWNLGLISLGSALCALAINGILIPRQFLSGGFTGLALILHYLSPSLPLGGIYFLLNVPNYAFGWKHVGRRFFLYSVAGMFIFSAALQGIHVSLPVYDELLSALLAGIIVGIGSGIILRSLGSAGGTDILSVIILKLFSVRLGTTILAFNSIILGAAALIFTLEKALYTMIYLFITSHMVNLVVTGLSQRKAVFIISTKPDELASEILKDIKHGLTILHGEGGYSKQPERVLYTVITFRYLGHLKRVVKCIDPDAFVVVSDTREVMNYRIGNQPHW